MNKEIYDIYTSERFLKIPKDLNKNTLNELFSLADIYIRMTLADGNSVTPDNALDFLESAYNTNSTKENIIVNHYLNQLGLTESDLSDNDLCDKVIDYISKKMTTTTLKYHATSSAHVDSILENGLSPSKRLVELEEIKKINDIYAKNNVYGSPFGSLFVNCVNRVCWESSPQNSFSYGKSAPEWFANFVGYAGYVNRDYDMANKFILSSINDFPPEDQKEVYNFFNKCWSIYGKSEPVLFVIPECDNIDNLDKFNFWKNNKFISNQYSLDSRTGLDRIETGVKMIFDFQDCVGAFNYDDPNNIDVKDALMFQMPLTLNNPTNSFDMEEELKKLEAEFGPSSESSNSNADSNIEINLDTNIDNFEL